MVRTFPILQSRHYKSSLREKKNSWGINPHGGNSVLYRSGFSFYVGNEKVLLLTFSGVCLQFTSV